MFTASCFIRKNTPELINKLIDLGYVKALFDEEYTKSNAYGLIVEQGAIFPLEPGRQERELMFTYNFVDCGENEDLFLALAALRDDSDINQYFICDKVSFTLGKTYYPYDYLYYQYDEFFDKQNWHKATVEELIEHFKKD